MIPKSGYRFSEKIMRQVRPLLHGLPMQREIETFAFHFGGHAQADNRVEDLEDDQRDDGVVHDNDDDAFDLVDHLRGVAFDQAGGATVLLLSLIHISEPTRLGMISYAVFCL